MFDLNALSKAFGGQMTSGEFNAAGEIVPTGYDPNNLAYFLSMMGKGIDPKGFGGIVGEDTQQQVRTNKFGALLKKALAGGGKVNIDGDKTTVNIPHGALDEIPDYKTALDEAMTGKVSSGKPSMLDATALGNAFSGGSNVNVPFSLGPQATGIELSDSDLVGLTTSDLMAAIELKRRVDQEPFERMKDLVQMKYTMGLIDNLEFDNQLKLMQALSKEDKYDLRDEFEDVNKARVLAGKQPLGFDDFYMMKTDGVLREYQKYVDQEKAAGRTPLGITPWKTDLVRAGATINDIGGAVEKTKALEFAKADAAKIIEIQANDFITNIEKSVRSGMESEKKLNRRPKSYTEEQLAELQKTDKKAYDAYRFSKLPADQKIKINTAKEINNRIINALDPKNEGKVTAVNKNGTIWWYYRENPSDDKSPMQFVRKY